MRPATNAAFALLLLVLACGGPPADGEDGFDTACDPCTADEMCIIHVASSGSFHSAECVQTEVDCVDQDQCSEECQEAFCEDYEFCDEYCDSIPGAFVCCGT